MQKPLPEFSSSDWERKSPRTKFTLIREFVLDHDGPIPRLDVCRILAEICKVSIDLVAETHMASRFTMDQVEVARLLHEQIAMFERVG